MKERIKKITHMEVSKMEKNNRSTTSKVLFGTFLTNGLVLAAFGIFGLFAALYYQASEYSSEFFLFGGGILLLIGVCLVSVHFVKKKDN